MEEISEIKKRLGEISNTLQRIEDELARANRPATQLEGAMVRTLRRLIELYYMMIDYMDRSQKLYNLAGGDDIKVWIIRTLYKHGEMNVFNLTKAIKESRGKASRRIVAKKLVELEKEGIVSMVKRGREKIYFLNL
jgi:DNA-binding transcriptional ArsR family regulator